MTGEIKVGDGSSYEKVFNVILNRCAPKSENPITNFVDKVLAGDIDKYVTNNATICPIKTVRTINKKPVTFVHAIFLFAGSH